MVQTHDPWLNWTIINNSGQAVDDFEIVVDSSTYSNSGTLDQLMIGLPFFNQFSTSVVNNNTVLKWSGPAGSVQPGVPAHIGALMKDSGPILDAYWTAGGQRVGVAPPIVMETTRLLFSETPTSAQVSMRLAMSGGFFSDTPTGQVGLTQIQTFRDIPSSLLGLQDINESLNLGDLAAYQVTPYVGGSPLSTSDVVWFTGPGPDSFFDVFLDLSTTSNLGSGYESLLYAQVLTPNTPGIPVQVQFWNLNPQSPEPATLTILALGGAVLLSRRRR